MDPFLKYIESMGQCISGFNKGNYYIKFNNNLRLILI